MTDDQDLIETTSGTRTSTADRSAGNGSGSDEHQLLPELVAHLREHREGAQ